MKLKTGDNVVVISGANKGKEGKITDRALQLNREHLYRNQSACTVYAGNRRKDFCTA